MTQVESDNIKKEDPVIEDDEDVVLLQQVEDDTEYLLPSYPQLLCYIVAALVCWYYISYPPIRSDVGFIDDGSE